MLRFLEFILMRLKLMEPFFEILMLYITIIGLPPAFIMFVLNGTINFNYVFKTNYNPILVLTYVIGLLICITILFLIKLIFFHKKR